MKSYFAIGTRSNKNWIKTESIERGTDNKTGRCGIPLKEKKIIRSYQLKYGFYKKSLWKDATLTS